MAPKGQNDSVSARDAGTVTAPNAFQKLISQMSDIATLEEKGSRFTGDDIIPILESESEEEMWDSDERPSYNAKMLSGCALEIRTFEVKFGTSDEIQTPFVSTGGKQMYLLVHSVRLNKSGDKKELRLPEPGEEFVWNTSARYIVGKLFWMLRNGWFDEGHSPIRVRIEGTDLPGGKSVEKLKKLEPSPIITS